MHNQMDPLALFKYKLNTYYKDEPGHSSHGLLLHVMMLLQLLDAFAATHDASAATA